MLEIREKSGNYCLKFYLHGTRLASGFVRNIKQAMVSLIQPVISFWNSSIGKKILVALSGAFLVFFLIGHLAGNLLVFTGRGALNDYAQFLHEMGHGKGVWIFRIGLLVALVLHIAATVALTRQNRSAKGSQYAHNATMRASRSSKIMIWSGLIVLAFLVFHIFHFTIRVNPELADMADPAQPERHDVWGMVIKGFENPLVSLFYIVALTLLCSHLSHGIASMFQTLGLRTGKTKDASKIIGIALAVALWLGFISIPVAVMTGLLKADSSGYSDTKASVIEAQIAKQ